MTGPKEVQTHDRAGMDTDQLWQVIRGRRSVRSFRPDPIPRAALLRAIESAGWAPSPHGRQPWRFVVIESAAVRRQLADAMAATWLEQLQLDGQDEPIVMNRLHNSRERLVTAPALIVVCLMPGVIDRYPDESRQEAEMTMAVQSLGAAVQNALLSIYADGLDAGWMCAPLFCPEIVRDVCHLDGALEPHALLPVGYVAKEPRRRPHAPVEELIVSWL